MLKPFEIPLLKSKLKIDEQNKINDPSDEKSKKYTEIIDPYLKSNILKIKYDNGISSIDLHTKALKNENCICIAYKCDAKKDLDLVIKTLNNMIISNNQQNNLVVNIKDTQQYLLRKALRKKIYCPQKINKIDYEIIKMRESQVAIENSMNGIESVENINAETSSATKKPQQLLRESSEDDDDDDLSELSIHDISECPSPASFDMAKLNKNRSAISKRKVNPVISIIPIMGKGVKLDSSLDKQQYAKEKQEAKTNFSMTNPDIGFDESFTTIGSNRPATSTYVDARKNLSGSKNPRAVSVRGDRKSGRIDTNQFRRSPSSSPNPYKQYVKVFEKYPGLDLNNSNSIITSSFLQNESRIYANTAFDNLLKNYSKQYDYEIENFVKSQKVRNIPTAKIDDSPTELVRPISRLSSNNSILYKNPTERSEKRSPYKFLNGPRSPHNAKKSLHINAVSKLPQLPLFSMKVQSKTKLQNFRPKSVDKRIIQPYQRQII